MEQLNVKATTGKLIRLLVCDDKDEYGRVGADVVAETVRGIDEPAISFAGGTSPLPVYDRLAELVDGGEITFRKVRAYLLNEWFGIPAGHHHTFRRYIDEHLFDRVDIAKERVHYFEGRVEDHMRTCFEFEQAIEAVGGIDLHILGIGTNGHISFNEPGTNIDTRTRLIKLSETTRLNYADYFDSLASVPRHALSQGLANILEARSILLLAFGYRKDEILFRCLKEPVTADVPASFLQQFEREITLVSDRQAARLFLE